MDEDADLSRRGFLLTAAASTAAAAGAAGTVAGQEEGNESGGNESGGGGGNESGGGGGNQSGGGNESGGGGGNESGGGGGGGGNQQPDFGGHLDGVDGGYQDFRGQQEATVMVGASGNGGNLAFEPAGIWVDGGTTVTWEWTGEGGGHNVAVTEGDHDFSSEVNEESGFTFEHTFEGGGISNYVCEPHESLNMKGAVAVGGDVPTVEAEGGGGGGGAGVPTVPNVAKSLGVAAFIAMSATLGLAFFFLKYGGDYGDVE